MLENLDKINWSQLSHAYGNASDVPDYLRSLLSPSIEVRKRAMWDLGSNVYHQGTTYEATPYVIPFLYELIEAPETQNKEDIVFFLLEMGRPMYEEQYTDDAIQAQSEKLKLEYEQFLNQASQNEPVDETFKNLFLNYREETLKRKNYIEATIKEVGKNLNKLYPYASNPNPDLRWIFAEALPAYPEHSSETIPLLQEMLIDETNEDIVNAINNAILTLRNKRNHS